MNYGHSIWSHVWFHVCIWTLSKVYYNEISPLDLHFPFITVFSLFVDICILSWAAHQGTEDWCRVTDVKDAAAVACEWQANLGEQECVCMFALKWVSYLWQVHTLLGNINHSHISSTLKCIVYVMVLYIGCTHAQYAALNKRTYFITDTRNCSHSNTSQLPVW